MFEPRKYQAIEQYLLAKRDWVSVRDICRLFGVRERVLRQLGRREGALTFCAISHPRKGIKHVACATTSEYLHAKHAMRRHAISELRRVAAWDRRRREVVRTIARPPIIIERDTGQLIMSFREEAPIRG